MLDPRFRFRLYLSRPNRPRKDSSAAYMCGFDMHRAWRWDIETAWGTVNEQITIVAAIVAVGLSSVWRRRPRAGDGPRRYARHVTGALRSSVAARSRP